MIVFLSDRRGRFDAWVGQTKGDEFVNIVSEQDDLVMALALAAWPARKFLVPRQP